MAKNILGLDLGTNSIGWAFVKEATNSNEESSIEKIGVRVNPLTTDEQTNFEKGKPITTNAGRTLARSARRNLHRFKLRRENLLQILKTHKWIDNETILAENGNKTTFETFRLRALAAEKQLELHELVRVLFQINKKRGYKSSRKVNNAEEGSLIDGMEIAKKLCHENLTPGQYVLDLLKTGKKKVPDFYRSDLQTEFDRIWNFQKQFYNELFTDNLKEELKGKGKVATWTILKVPFNLVGLKRNLKRDELKLENYQWRNDTLSNQLNLEQIAIVLQEINGQLANSSGYLGAISDRSKELYFNNQTVGQYQYAQLQNNPHARLKNQVFYRQDYMDEFEKIWEIQAKNRENIFTNTLKEEIRDVVIFYQRKLKSQKGLISFCEFEQREIIKDEKKKTVGLRVIPKSVPLFQEFKIWQILHNIKLKNKITNEVVLLNENDKSFLFEELDLKGNLTASEVLKLLVDKPKDWEINYASLEGNRTNQALYNAYLTILDNEGYDVREELKLKLNKDDITLADIDKSASGIKEMVRAIFNHLGIKPEILDFNAELEGKAFEEQLSFQLWHLLYAYEEDNSPTGMDTLYRLLEQKFGFNKEQAKVMGTVAFQDDYGSLSSKAIRKIYPFIKENEYSVACDLAGYRHSKNSLTKEELENRELKSRLDILPKNSLRNPVVEKILNQMVNLVNTIIDIENDKLEKAGMKRNFQFDEIRIELARELKKNAKEREEMTKAMNAGKIKHEKIINILQVEDGIKFPTRNDIIRYKLYQELKNNGYKDLYTNQYIERKDIFTKKYDIEHIIPQSRLFDDSFSNKTLVPRQINLDKGNKTAYDYIFDVFGQDKLNEFLIRSKALFDLNDEGISKAKYKKLTMKGSEIGEGFIQRDLRDSQYIAKKAKEILFQITKSVLSTSGSVTDRLRDDWDLVNVMKELNLEKYRLAGLTEMQITKDGNPKEAIKDWTKRNDHRHHAMDALTVAFTKFSFIQYLNNLNARRNDKYDSISNAKDKKAIDTNSLRISSKDALGIEEKETHKINNGKGNYKRVFNEPIPNFRQLAKEHLEAVLVSHKAKNKVVTRNINKTKGSDKIQIALTPRGQMHDQTVYGWNRWSRVDLSKKLSKIEIEAIIDLKKRQFIKDFISEKGSISKAFTDENLAKLIFNNKSLKEIEISIPCYTQKIDLNKVLTDTQKTISAKKKVIKNILDLKVREKITERLVDYNGDFKKAFSDLDQNPIWLNEEKGIAIKRVTISGVKNAEALHTKKDHLGNDIFDEDGNKIPVDFVSTGNNHHVAIYEDEKGNLQDRVISFYEAVARINQGLPIVDKAYNHHLGWTFKFTMKQNEMFVFSSEDFNPNEIDLFDRKNQTLISKHLFRVQKFSKVEYGNSAVRDYVFRHHLESVISDVKELRDKTYKVFKSLGEFKGLIKVRTNHLGEIIHIGEY
ncbi:CRISPR-associated endonuclease Cas9 [Empedobacter brevis NBRC 14943 = ATCC 43319]|uniref:CRISPR-associated endonuclease Cas9 n=1 Tax=Empedobacter brevis NBRC 14943 = ATCC 43319 TaxID=1218108 RepID=A0A511NMM8_9FLAO|nr:type II CRISPR RNA-guided endonuclease Cas9 [Empedobacter brevis]GEM53718.1 CRISPR-associated endonuclease Cas9 [Empedobacter brevis NBRC 14943 = ATCC 43319]